MLTGVRARPPVRAIYGAILLIIFGIALSIRVCLPYDGVFVGDWVRLAETDPWYHMRLVEGLVQHFPRTIAFDPYTFFPYGQRVFFAPFFDLLLGFFIWIIGLGSPSQHTIEVVGVYFPAILGALVTIPVYLIGKELFNRNVGLLSAALVAILPGEFLSRSLLGFTDHHVAETLFSTLFILFLILALKRAKEKAISFNYVRSRDWGAIKKPLIYAALAGVTLGVYILSWVGGLLFVLILFSYAIVQYILDHLQGRSTDYLCIIGVPIFVTTLIVIAPLLNLLAFRQLCLISLAVGIVAFPVLSGVSRAMESQNIRRAYYPLALVAIGLVGLGGLCIIWPSLLRFVGFAFSLLAPQGGALTISEVQPLLYTPQGLSLEPAWHYFTTSFFTALVALLIVAYGVIREGTSDKTLLFVWSAMMLVATLSQRRFVYYFAVNVALLTGYLSWKILEQCGLGQPSRDGEAEGRKVEDVQKLKRGKKSTQKKRQRGKERREVRERRDWRRPSLTERVARYTLASVAIVVVFFGVYYPNTAGASTIASNPTGPNEDWHSSLVWMRENTPEPFQDPNFYYELYESPPRGVAYDYPESAYGVMSWWDYGHWITSIAHRIPNSNPHQAGAEDAALFFTAQDEASANEILDRLGSKYVIIDLLMATVKFYAMPIWAGEDPDKFWDTFYYKTAEGLKPLTLYYPEYYRSMCSRLYNFGGKAVVPENSTWVVSYIERVDAAGNSYKEIAGLQVFSTYEEAVAFLETHPGYRIVGINPFTSPVPLETLEHYQLIHQSDSIVYLRGSEAITYVEIFEYLP